MFLQDPQQFRLKFEWNVTDFIEEQSTPICNLEPARLAYDGPCKCAYSWPKSSLSSRPEGMAAQFSLISGRSRRALRLWIARAIGHLSKYVKQFFTISISAFTYDP